jgi:phosphoribosylamine---glycine ligase
MKVLVLGSGGREHALTWKLRQSSLVHEIFCLPGNSGTEVCGVNLPGSPLDFARIKEVVIDHHIGLVVVGPEDPLVEGIHDFFLGDPDLRTVPVIGPQASGARLEGSKAFAKEFMVRHHIPTAAYRVFSTGETVAACAFLETLRPPYVLKADGLAAGKGVVIHAELGAARADIHAILDGGRFGKAGESLVIEEFLDGIEVSVFVLTDGEHYLILPEAKDYKRIGEGDTGLNTGGMGSLSPVPFYDSVLQKKVEDRIIAPTICGLQQDGIPYSGFIFFGLMVVQGDPYVIEYNVRMGDPEAESVIPRIENDLAELFTALSNSSLHKHSIKTSHLHAAAVMLVSSGYPGDYEKGKEISVPEMPEGTLVFHAGAMVRSGKLYTNGGRVMAVTSLDANLRTALSRSYDLAEQITFDGKHYRKDLGFDLV